jgi:hypothetical protein
LHKTNAKSYFYPWLLLPLNFKHTLTLLSNLIMCCYILSNYLHLLKVYVLSLHVAALAPSTLQPCTPAKALIMHIPVIMHSLFFMIAIPSHHSSSRLADGSKNDGALLGLHGFCLLVGGEMEMWPCLLFCSKCLELELVLLAEKK